MDFLEKEGELQKKRGIIGTMKKRWREEEGEEEDDDEEEDRRTWMSGVYGEGEERWEYQGG